MFEIVALVEKKSSKLNEKNIYLSINEKLFKLNKKMRIKIGKVN